jgi:hypothetical protein
MAAADTRKILAGMKREDGSVPGVKSERMKREEVKRDGYAAFSHVSRLHVSQAAERVLESDGLAPPPIWHRIAPEEFAHGQSQQERI